MSSHRVAVVTENLSLGTQPAPVCEACISVYCWLMTTQCSRQASITVVAKYGSKA